MFEPVPFVGDDFRIAAFFIRVEIIRGGCGRRRSLAGYMREGEWEKLFDPFWAGCASGAIGGAFRVRPRAWRDRGGRFFADGLQVLLPFL